MSAAIAEKPAKTAPPRNRKAEFLSLFTEFLQEHVDGVAKSRTLPPCSVGRDVKTPMETYEAGQRDGKPILKERPRRACEIDEAGNVRYGSGPVVGDPVALQLIEMLTPHVEYFMEFALSRMSACAMHPESGGLIDDRTKIISIPKGRFVFVREGHPVQGD